PDIPMRRIGFESNMLVVSWCGERAARHSEPGSPLATLSLARVLNILSASFETPALRAPQDDGPSVTPSIVPVILRSATAKPERVSKDASCRCSGQVRHP